MRMPSEGYRSLSRKPTNAADDLCRGRIVFIQEGGDFPWTLPLFGTTVLEELLGIGTGAVDPHLAYHKALGGQAHEAAAIDAASAEPPTHSQAGLTPAPSRLG
ncbi:hypothetical protein ASE17_19050 [Phenylobacterium sp. Root77]|nr:hypothetical protein ASC73_20470 [Phenylobacterium sp. Root1277]KQW94240.1 hypothetical protein ASC79_00330 [Phenylobacterium sp. Root1290]KRC38958.1 hypothetical protein ASE17_19050 [Phenylobacterium sp. Root77]